MTFREFVEWCNKRACDGCWSMNTAITCIGIIREIKSVPFWRRKQKWSEIKKEVVEQIVEPIDEKRKQYFSEEKND